MTGVGRDGISQLRTSGPHQQHHHQLAASRQRMTHGSRARTDDSRLLWIAWSWSRYVTDYCLYRTHAWLVWSELSTDEWFRHAPLSQVKMPLAPC